MPEESLDFQHTCRMKNGQFEPQSLFVMVNDRAGNQNRKAVIRTSPMVRESTGQKE
ncbi:MAG: hypothetical protein WCF44_20380 [Candidatus Methylophosphatis roskildensis]